MEMEAIKGYHDYARVVEMMPGFAGYCFLSDLQLILSSLPYKVDRQ